MDEIYNLQNKEENHNLFVAEYPTTDASAVQSALSAGKYVVTKLGYDFIPVVYADNYHAMFCGLVGGGEGGAGGYSMDVNFNTGWSEPVSISFATYPGVQGMISSKMDTSASGDFYPMTGNPSGFLTTPDLSSYATEQWVNDQSYMHEYMASAFYSADNPSGFITNNDITGKQDNLTFGYNDTAISAINTSALYDTSAHARISTLSTRISDLSSNKLDTATYATDSGTFLTGLPTGLVNESGFEYNDSNKISAYNGSAFAIEDQVVTSTASGEYYDYNHDPGYHTAISGINNSALMAQWSRYSDYAVYDINSRQLTGLASEEYVDSSVSGKQDKLTFHYVEI